MMTGLAILVVASYVGVEEKSPQRVKAALFAMSALLALVRGMGRGAEANAVLTLSWLPIVLTVLQTTVQCALHPLYMLLFVGPMVPSR